MTTFKPDDRAEDSGATRVGPEDEKRETLDGEPSAAQAVKEAARRELSAETEHGGSDAKLMGLDAPGFGDRSAEELREASHGDASTRVQDDEIVDAEFADMDNDLIDMGDFGQASTGAGTQTGGAGTRLEPSRDDENGVSQENSKNAVAEG